MLTTLPPPIAAVEKIVTGEGGSYLGTPTVWILPLVPPSTSASYLSCSKCPWAPSLWSLHPVPSAWGPKVCPHHHLPPIAPPAAFEVLATPHACPSMFASSSTCPCLCNDCAPWYLPSSALVLFPHCLASPHCHLPSITPLALAPLCLKPSQAIEVVVVVIHTSGPNHRLGSRLEPELGLGPELLLTAAAARLGGGWNQHMFCDPNQSGAVGVMEGKLQGWGGRTGGRVWRGGQRYWGVGIDGESGCNSDLEPSFGPKLELEAKLYPLLTLYSSPRQGAFLSLILNGRKNLVLG